MLKVMTYLNLKRNNMTTEEKILLLKDLSARLPYGVEIQHPNYDEPQELDTIFNYNAYVDGIIQCACDDIDEIVEHQNSLTACRPYLRPMSSMTEEEKIEYNSTKTLSIIDYPTLKSYDWLNAHHFDYRGLIEKGLAIAVTEDNNPYRNEEL